MAVSRLGALLLLVIVLSSSAFLPVGAGPRPGGGSRDLGGMEAPAGPGVSVRALGYVPTLARLFAVGPGGDRYYVTGDAIVSGLNASFLGGYKPVDMEAWSGGVILVDSLGVARSYSRSLVLKWETNSLVRDGRIWIGDDSVAIYRPGPVNASSGTVMASLLGLGDGGIRLLATLTGGAVRGLAQPGNAGLLVARAYGDRVEAWLYSHGGELLSHVEAGLEGYSPVGAAPLDEGFLALFSNGSWLAAALVRGDGSTLLGASPSGLVACDPWSMVSSASALTASNGSVLAVVAVRCAGGDGGLAWLRLDPDGTLLVARSMPEAFPTAPVRAGGAVVTANTSGWVLAAWPGGGYWAAQAPEPLMGLVPAGDGLLVGLSKNKTLIIDIVNRTVTGQPKPRTGSIVVEGHYALMPTGLYRVTSSGLKLLPRGTRFLSITVDPLEPSIVYGVNETLDGMLAITRIHNESAERVRDLREPALGTVWLAVNPWDRTLLVVNLRYYLINPPGPDSQRTPASFIKITMLNSTTLEVIETRSVVTPTITHCLVHASTLIAPGYTALFAARDNEKPFAIVYRGSSPSGRPLISAHTLPGGHPSVVSLGSDNWSILMAAFSRSGHAYEVSIGGDGTLLPLASPGETVSYALVNSSTLEKIGIISAFTEKLANTYGLTTSYSSSLRGGVPIIGHNTVGVYWPGTGEAEVIIHTAVDHANFIQETEYSIGASSSPGGGALILRPSGSLILVNTSGISHTLWSPRGGKPLDTCWTGLIGGPVPILSVEGAYYAVITGSTPVLTPLSPVLLPTRLEASIGGGAGGSWLRSLTLTALTWDGEPYNYTGNATAQVRTADSISNIEMHFSGGQGTLTLAGLRPPIMGAVVVLNGTLIPSGVSAIMSGEAMRPGGVSVRVAGLSTVDCDSTRAAYNVLVEGSTALDPNTVGRALSGLYRGRVSIVEESYRLIVNLSGDVHAYKPPGAEWAYTLGPLTAGPRSPPSIEIVLRLEGEAHAILNHGLEGVPPLRVDMNISVAVERILDLPIRAYPMLEAEAYEIPGTGLLALVIRGVPLHGSTPRSLLEAGIRAYTPSGSDLAAAAVALDAAPDTAACSLPDCGACTRTAAIALLLRGEDLGNATTLTLELYEPGTPLENHTYTVHITSILPAREARGPSAELLWRLSPHASAPQTPGPAETCTPSPLPPPTAAQPSWCSRIVLALGGALLVLAALALLALRRGTRGKA